MKTASIVAAAAVVAPALCQYESTLVTPEALVDAIELDDLVAGAQQLQDFADANGGNRAFGGPGHNATVTWLYDTLVATGYYDVYLDPFVELFTGGKVAFTADGTDIAAEYMTYAPAGDVSGPIVNVADLGCNATDYPAEVSGAIALISRGICPFAEKATLAKAAGAVGAIIYNNVEGFLSGTLGGVGDYPPTGGITQVDGEALVEAVAAGPVQGTVAIEVVSENRTTYNVIAQTKGGDKNNVVALGGHTDSVFIGPGINDDGSGTVGNLVVAQALAKFSVKNAVRFGFWSAEEYGLLGSYHYVKTINGTFGGNASEVAKVRAYLNFDMTASPNYVLGVYDGDGSAFNLSGPAGSDTIEYDFEDFFASKNLSSVPSEFSGRSDYAAFIENGVPSGGLFTGAEEIKTEAEAALFGGEAGVAYDINYHRPGDNIDNLNLDAFLWNTQAVANSVAKYALSFDGIPAPNATLAKRSAGVSALKAKFQRATEMARREKSPSSRRGKKML